MSRSTKRDVPKHVRKMFGSERAFKRAKRKQAAQLLKLVGQLRVGCAYLPGGEDAVHRLQKDADYLAEITSRNEWGD